MREEIRPPTAENLLEELRAEKTLAQMDLSEDLVVAAETETCPRLRRQLAARYARAIGVEPERRQELRAALERVKAGGGMPVADVIDLVNRHGHAKKRH